MASGTIPKYADGTDSRWQQIENSSTFRGTAINVRRIGDIVFLYATNLYLTTDLSSGLYRLLGSKLLADYAPSGVVSIWAGSLTKMGQLRITNDGSANFFRPSTAETWKARITHIDPTTGQEVVDQAGDAITFSVMYIAA